MSIIGVTSARPAIGFGLLQSVVEKLRTAKSASIALGVAESGPAFLLGGGAAKVGQGLYDATGMLLGTANSQINPRNPQADTTEQQKKRNESLNAAAIQIRGGEIEAGRAGLEKLLSEDPADVTALRFLGHSYTIEQNYTRAEQYYARASALAPSDARARSDLIGARVLQKDDKEVLAEARRRLDSPTHLLEGLSLLFRLAERSPNSADVYTALADGFTAAGKPQQVADALQQAIRNADDQQIGEVIPRVRQLVRSYRQVGLAHNILGRALKKAGRFAEAIESLKTAMDLAPDDFAFAGDLADAYVGRAQTKLKAGDVTAAETDLRTARSIGLPVAGVEDVAAGIAIHRADRDITRGMYTSAVVRLRNVGANPPTDEMLKKQSASLFARLGAHYESEGDNTLALTNYKQAFALNPESSAARRNVGALSHAVGMVAKNASNYDLAISHLQRAYDTYRAEAGYGADLADAYDFRGQMRVSLNKLDDAIADYEKGLAVDPSNAALGAHYLAALALKNGS